MKKSIKLQVIVLAFVLYVCNTMVYASDERTAVNALPYVLKDEVAKDYIERYVPEDAEFIPAKVTSKFISNVDEKTGNREVEDSGFVSNVYTFSSLENGEKRYDIIVDCYFLKTWKPYENDRLSIFFNGAMLYINRGEGELWGRDSKSRKWSFERKLDVDISIIDGVAIGNTSQYPRILLHFSNAVDTVYKEGQEQSYLITYEMAERKIPKYFFVILAGIVVIVGGYGWKKFQQNKKENNQQQDEP